MDSNGSWVKLLVLTCIAGSVGSVGNVGSVGMHHEPATKERN